MIVLSVAGADPSPTGTSIRACAPCERTDWPPTPAANAIRLLDIGVLPEAPVVVLNQQPAARRARCDDLIGLPSTWVVARIAGRTG